jgi:hypothetical protein
MALTSRGGRLAIAIWLFSIPCCAQSTDGTSLEQSESEKLLLDQLMAAESGGRQFAKNPRSSALGPYQFIESTFLDIMHRKLPELRAGKSAAEISRLRVDPKVSRHAALIYLRESAQFFVAHKVPVTPANLRLAFFVGQTGALRVLAAKSDKPLSSILTAPVIAANPPLGALTAGQLIERSSRETGGLETVASGPQPAPLIADPPKEKVSREADTARTVAVSLEPKALTEGSVAGKSNQEGENVGAVARFSEAPPAGPDIEVRCNLQLPSCRKWLALAETCSQTARARLSATSREQTGHNP